MMSSPLAVAVFVVAAALSLGASAILVVRLERVGARLGLSEALLGLVAALAADTPEVTSAVTALAHGQHDVGTGVVLGSNVFNLAALIGLGAVVAGGIKLHRRVVLFEGTVALWIAALTIAAVTGLITPVAALALALAVLAPYVYVSALHPVRTGLRSFRHAVEFPREAHKLALAAAAKLGAGMSQMRFDRTGADVQLAADLRRGVATRRQPGDVQFPRRQRGRSAARYRGTPSAVAETGQPPGYPIPAHDRTAPVVRIRRAGEHFDGGAAGRRCDSGDLGGHRAEEPTAEPVQGIRGLGGGSGGTGRAARGE
jgi:hypothetical protein